MTTEWTNEAAIRRWDAIREAEPTTPGIEGYVHLPDFLIVAATR